MVPQGGETAAAGAAGTYQSSQFGSSPAGTSTGVGFSGGAYNDRRGGGGGGAGSAARSNRNGGTGLTSDITGESLVYGSGGGGGGMFHASTIFVRPGGTGGDRAGHGGTYEVVGTSTNICCATAPAPNSGCGGGGGLAYAAGTAEQQSATGGADGIVVIRYQIPVTPCVGGDIIRKRLIRGTRYSYVHIFTNTAAVASFANLTDRNISLRYLVVGAGGAGAKGYSTDSGGGGGGGGGVYENDGYELAKGASLAVTVGQGASAVESKAGSAAAGASILTDDASFTITVPGGGNGAYTAGSNTSVGSSATQGAGGGGGARYMVPQGGDTAAAGAAGTYQSSQFGDSPAGTSTGVGFSGGAYNDRRGGGGGGAGSAARSNRNGGTGLTSDITGESLVYGSGGGGGGMFYSNTIFVKLGGTGGSRAGNGGTYEVVGTATNICCATAPAPNSGCGGGGGLAYAAGTAEQQSATGGADGIVVIRYEYDPNRRGFVLSFR